MKEKVRCISMDDQLRTLYQERASLHETLGVLHVQKKDMLSPVTDGYDAVILIITNNVQEEWYVEHYIYEEKKVQFITVNKDELNQWLAAGSNRRAVEWIMYGKVVFDRNEYVSSLKERLEGFPFDLRKKRLCVEFGRLIRRYQEGKELLKSQHYLDAYNQILHALHHWARLAVIEHGFHPEVTLWRQVKTIEPEIYKLYEELITGKDPLEKRMELLLIASEFSLGSKTKLATTHLIEVLEQKDKHWFMKDLIQHPEVKEYSLDLSILLEHLVKKNIVEEVYLQNEAEKYYARAYRLCAAS